MFILSARNFRYWFSGALIVFAAAALLVVLFRSAPGKADVDAAALRAENEIALCRSFLASRGWSVSSDTPEISDVTVPETFGPVYAAYNELQKAQGYDLEPYRGVRLRKYLFRVTAYPGLPQDDSIRAAVLTADGEIVGGDICSVRPDGFMHGFSFETVEYEFYPS